MVSSPWLTFRFGRYDTARLRSVQPKIFTLVVTRTIHETNGRVDACQLTESKVTGFTVTGHLAARSDANAASTGPRPWIRTQYAYAIGGAKVVSTNECLVRTSV